MLRGLYKRKRGIMEESHQLLEMSANVFKMLLKDAESTVYGAGFNEHWWVLKCAL